MRHFGAETSGMQVDSGFYLLGTAALIGLRHGVDCDHIAAIADITGSEFLSSTKQELNARFLRLPLLYALGHCFIVTILALSAKYALLCLPSWLDQLMERIVGFSLLIFGIWIIGSICVDLHKRKTVRLLGRWSVFSFWMSKLFALPEKHKDEKAAKVSSQCSSPAAFGLGILHGIGAETGTQLLLISTVASTVGYGKLLSVLAAFSCGMILSNCMIASAMGAGFFNATRRQIASAAVGILAACFSIIVGACCLAGMSMEISNLPQIQQPLTISKESA